MEPCEDANFEGWQCVPGLTFQMLCDEEKSAKDCYWYIGEGTDGTMHILELVQRYLIASRSQIENGHTDIGFDPVDPCLFTKTCPCPECQYNPAWDMNVDFGDCGAVNVEEGQAQHNLISCLVRAIGLTYKKVAGKEK